MHSFDYTKESNIDTLRDYPLQGYRLMHWLEDVISNWLCDPINMKDERLISLLGLNKLDEETLQALCSTGTPYNTDTKLAGSTPKVIISLGGTEYADTPLLVGNKPNALNGSIPARNNMKIKNVALKVSVYTESYDGTVLLAGLLEDFLAFNESSLLLDNGSLSSFIVKGTSEVTEIKQGGAANAKTLYASTIMVVISGGITWTKAKNDLSGI